MKLPPKKFIFALLKKIDASKFSAQKELENALEIYPGSTAEAQIRQHIALQKRQSYEHISDVINYYLETRELDY